MAQPSQVRNISPITYTSQQMDNWSFDGDFKENTVEIVCFDPINNTLRRVTSDAMAHFATNDIDKNSSTVFYEGLQDNIGNWQIVQTTTTGNVSAFRFATKLNNASFTDYPTAWTNRTTLTYDYYATAFSTYNP